MNTLGFLFNNLLLIKSKGEKQNKIHCSFEMFSPEDIMFKMEVNNSRTAYFFIVIRLSTSSGVFSPIVFVADIDSSAS